MKDLDIKEIGNQILIREPLQILEEICDVISASDYEENVNCEVYEESNPPLLVISFDPNPEVILSKEKWDEAKHLTFGLLFDHLAKNVRKVSLDEKIL